MKPLLDTLRLSLVTAFFFPLFAQAETIYRTQLVCVTAQELVPVLEKYQEKPILKFSAHRVVGNSVVNLPSVLYMNSTTKTWTLIEQWAEDLFCVVSIGSDSEPILSGEKI
jgi:UDP-glucose 4-epimerase